MKRQSTTLVSKGLVTKSLLVACAVLMVIAAPLSLQPKVHADKYDDQIRALQQQADQAQGQADQLRQAANTLANKLAELSVQKAGIQTQVDISQANYDKLQQQIADNEQKIKDNQSALGSTIADLYVDDAISPLEMLASSKNIGDYVDKQTYQSSVRDTLTKTIDTIKTLKVKLEQDKQAVKDVLDKQTAQRNSLASVEQQQQVLLDQTKGEEAAYQSQASAAKSQLESVSSQQRAYYQSLVSRGVGGSSSGVSGSFQYSGLTPNDGGSGCGGGGYPYCGGQDTYADPWGLYNRECVSYVAWALSARFHRYVGNFGGAGNAYQWPSSAPANSGAMRVSSPQAGDAVILPQSGGFAPLGHAMIVESVSGDTAHVSQYNFYGSGAYSTMDIKISGVIFLRFPSE
jgi:peptidoglycan hydrolase CwlO-like protein